MKSAPRPPEPHPDRLGRYAVGPVLGVGGSGVVYRAILRGPGGIARPVALKVLRRGSASLRREARMGGLLRHRNLVDVYEVDEDGGRWFCAMELCGEPLSRHLPLPPRAVVEVGLQVCAALHYAHAELGLVHLDLKPQNLLIGGDGQVKVADLGIARAAGFEGDGRVRGTPGYMAPEQARGRPVDARADLYALGVTLVELATGARPRISETIDLDTLDTDPTEALDAAGIPRWLEPAVGRCLAPLRDDRWPDMAALAAALRGIDAEGPGLQDAIGWERHELPVPADLPPTPLIGRDRDLARVDALLATPGLVTLKGPAGVGKTRLAAEAAKRHGGDAWFCDLTEVVDLDGLVAVVGIALGAPRTAGTAADHVERLGHALANRGAVLLVLDNFEQIVELAAVPARWVARAPELRIVVTSRQPLRIDGERVLDVEPLGTEAATALLRARARERGAELGDDARLGDLVERLDGLPLVLELAAGRLGVLSIGDLLDRWDLSLLRSGADGRHGALRTALDGSWELLTDPQRRAFAELSVFEGGFTPEAAEAVIAADRGGIAPVDALQALFELSLVQRAAHGRFRMLVGVHAYAHERLVEAGGAVDAERRHAAYFARYGREDALDALVRDPIGTTWRIEDRENVIAAARRSTAAGDVLLAVPTSRAAHGLLERGGELIASAEVLERVLALPGLTARERARLSGALASVLRVCGRIADAEAWAGEAIRYGEEVGDHRSLALALACQGLVLHHNHGQPDLARERFLQAIRQAQLAGDRRSEVMAMANLGTLERERGALDQAVHWYMSAQAIQGDEGLDPRAEAMLARNLGVVALDRGDLEGALARLDEAHGRVLALQDRRWEAIVLGDLGWVYMDMDRLEDAAAAQQASLTLGLQVGEQGQEASMRNNLGLIHLSLGRLEEAQAQFERALQAARDGQVRRTTGVTMGNLGRVHWLLGDAVAARALYAEALAIHREYDYPYGQPYWLSGLALLDAEEGRLEEATAHADEAVRIAAPFAAVLAESLAAAARVALRAGRPEAAREAVARASALGRRGREGVVVRAVRALVAACTGDPDARSAIDAVASDPVYACPRTEVARVIAEARARIDRGADPEPISR